MRKLHLFSMIGLVIISLFVISLIGCKETPVETEESHDDAIKEVSDVKITEDGVKYIVVGSLEQSTYGEAGLRKFERNLEPVFESAGVTIYPWNTRTK